MTAPELWAVALTTLFARAVYATGLRDCRRWWTGVDHLDDEGVGR